MSRFTATGSQTVGPFFHFGLATDASLGVIAGPDTPGERIRLQVRVFDGDDAPVPDAMVELYQADAAGRYAQPRVPSEAGFTGFGRLPTANDGSCVFETIRPGRVRDEQGRSQAPHINVCLFMRGLLRHIYARIYFAGDTDFGTDPLAALVPADRRDTLVAHPHPTENGAWVFDIRLQGERETAFFDI
jgi:protocatechuate 3,4-dioxygenase alpha subunit